MYFPLNYGYQANIIYSSSPARMLFCNYFTELCYCDTLNGPKIGYRAINL